MYLDARPHSSSAHAQMSLMAFREHASDAHVPLNGGELTKSQILTWCDEAGFFFLQLWKCEKTHGTRSFKSSILLPAIPVPS